MTNEIHSLTSQQAQDYLNAALFIDVREAFELPSGMIAGAKHIPLAQLLTQPEMLEELPHDKKIIIYCQHGVRSLTAAKHLQANGFSDIANLSGGIVQWNGKLV